MKLLSGIGALSSEGRLFAGLVRAGRPPSWIRLLFSDFGHA